MASGGAGGYVTSGGLYNAPAAGGADTVVLKYNSTQYAMAAVTVSGAAVPKVSVAATDGNCKESLTGNLTAVYTLTRTGSTTAAMTVNFGLTGTATINSDYTIDHTANVTIPIGSASTTVTVTRMDDTLIEGNETVILTLTSGSGYAIDSASYTSTTTVIDDDLPTITVSATNASETGPTNGVYTFTRTGTYQYGSTALTVDFAMTGTATNGQDYNKIYGFVVIPAGQTRPRSR